MVASLAKAKNCRNRQIAKSRLFLPANSSCPKAVSCGNSFHAFDQIYSASQSGADSRQDSINIVPAEKCSQPDRDDVAFIVDFENDSIAVRLFII